MSSASTTTLQDDAMEQYRHSVRTSETQTPDTNVLNDTRFG